MTRSQIMDTLQRQDVSNFDLIFANLIVSATAGERWSREMVIDRLWGKVRDVDVIAFSGEQEMMGKIPMDELVALYRKYNQDPIDADVSEQNYPF